MKINNSNSRRVSSVEKELVRKLLKWENGKTLLSENRKLISGCHFKMIDDSVIFTCVCKVAVPIFQRKDRDSISYQKVKEHLRKAHGKNKKIDDWLSPTRQPQEAETSLPLSSSQIDVI